MEHQLMVQFLEEQNIIITNPVAILDLILSCDRGKLEYVLKDPTTLNIINKYKQYEDKVRMGHLGKIAQFWLSFIDHSRLIFMLLYSIKVNDLKLFHKCHGDMADLFFAYGGQNYDR